MAPEHFENRPLEQPTDMYAMGAIYYYALTGEYPFNGDTALMVMAAHLQHHVKHLSELRPDLPKWACDWVMWHLEREMDMRPQNARESLKQFHGSERKTIEALLATGSVDLKAVSAASGPIMKVDEESGLVQLSASPMVDVPEKEEDPQPTLPENSPPDESAKASSPSSVSSPDPVTVENIPPMVQLRSLIIGLVVTIVALIVIIAVILIKV